MKTKLVFYLN